MRKKIHRETMPFESEIYDNGVYLRLSSINITKLLKSAARGLKILDKEECKKALLLLNTTTDRASDEVI